MGETPPVRQSPPGPRFGQPWICLSRPLTAAERRDFDEHTREINEHNLRVAEYAADLRDGRPIRLRLEHM